MVLAISRRTARSTRWVGEIRAPQPEILALVALDNPIGPIHLVEPIRRSFGSRLPASENREIAAQVVVRNFDHEVLEKIGHEALANPTNPGVVVLEGNPLVVPEWDRIFREVGVAAIRLDFLATVLILVILNEENLEPHLPLGMWIAKPSSNARNLANA